MASFGSFQNQIAGTDPATVPVVGMGATHVQWTDRAPYTVVEVISPRKLVVQEDHATRIDRNGMSECQAYEFTPNPDAPRVVIMLRRNGQWIREGESIKSTKYVLGHRSKYHDYSF